MHLNDTLTLVTTGLIPFIKSNNTKALILVRFIVLKKLRVAISILDFLSTLKQTIISSFLVSLVFINGIKQAELIVDELTFANCVVH